MLSILKKQRINVKSLFKYGKSATKTHLLLRVYGNGCLSLASIFAWFKSFQDGQEDIKDDVRPDLHSTSTT